jgi:hypothetical protein
MKNTVFLVLLFVGYSSLQCLAQKNSFGISIGTGKGIILKQALEGGPAYSLNTGFSIGTYFNRKITDRLHFNAGLVWFKSSVSVTPNYYPGSDLTPEDYNVQLIYVPMTVKAFVSKYIFFSGGVLADFDISKNSHLTRQGGMGATAGIGGRISLSGKLSLELNPYLNFHGLMLAKSDMYPERILDSGVKLSVYFE